MSVKKNKGKRFRVGTILIIAFALLYVPSLYHWVYSKNIATDIIRIGTVEDSINTDAFFVRDEDVIRSPIEGKCITEVVEGDKISSNYRIAVVVNKSSRKLLDALQELELKILETQKEKNKNRDFFSEDLVKIDREIGKKVVDIIKDNNENNLLDIRQLKDDIDGLIQKKAAIIGSSGSNAFLDSRLKEKQKLQDQINLGKKDIISGFAGIVSYMVDGYEEKMSPGTIRDLTPRFLESIKTERVNRVSNNIDVEAGKPFAKIIKGIDCYIVFYLEPKKAGSYHQGDSVKIRINEINRIVDGTIDYKSGIVDGRYIISVRIDEGISETAGLRKINADLIKNSNTGLRVPLKSLTDIDFNKMEAKIVLAKYNFASMRNVRIIGKNDEWAIIVSIRNTDNYSVSLYDSYVINPKNIKEGQMIN